MKKNLTILNFVLAFFLLAAITSCQKDEVEILRGELAFSLNGTSSSPVSDGGITPFISDQADNGGNVGCGDLFDDPGMLSSGRINVEDFATIEEFVAAFPQGIDVNVTDGKFVSFTATGYLVYAVIVKGGNNANVYYYEEGASFDSGLASPPNNSGSPAGLSNLTICYKPAEVEETCETAWAFGGEYALAFKAIEGLSANNWGWTNGALGYGNYSFEVYAAAGGNNLDSGTKVGYLNLAYQEGELKINLDLIAGFSLSEGQLYVGETQLPLVRRGRSWEMTNAPGQFPFELTTEEITLEFSGPIYVAAHAVVCGQF